MGKGTEAIDRIQTILLGSTDRAQAETLLREVLDRLDTESLRRVEAVMYSGRGDDSAVELLPVLAENHATRDDVIRTIIEMLPNLDQYLERGLDRAKAEGIDVDTF
jgi:hypothetical protein